MRADPDRSVETGSTAPAGARPASVPWSLRAFTGAGYDKGRPTVVQALWFAVSNLVFVKWWLPARFRVLILRAFGARIGEGVLIRHGVRVHWPWKLTIGADSWIGEGTRLLNLEPIEIGADVCLSQESYLCTGSHDRFSPTFEFDNGPIRIEDSAWIGTRATVLRGVTVGANSVVGAGAVVLGSLPAGALVPAATTGPARTSR